MFMDYKEATIPETAQKVMKEKTDDVAMNVTLMHLEENAQGEVKKLSIWLLMKMKKQT